jgi:hypothetical protein
MNADTWPLVGGSELQFFARSDDGALWIAPHCGRSTDTWGMVAINVPRAEAEAEAERWIARYGFRRLLRLVWVAP